MPLRMGFWVESYPKAPALTTIQLPSRESTGNGPLWTVLGSFSDDTECFSCSLRRETGVDGPPLLSSYEMILLSTRMSVLRKACIRAKLPIDPIKEDNDVTNEEMGSFNSANSDKDVNMRFMSRLLSPPRDWATRLYVAKVRIGAKIGARYAMVVS
jgi:hypothetical protein